MIAFNEVKRASARKNDTANRRLHFFASRFSLYFSWVFINLGLSANQVTGIFFLVGLTGSFFFLSSEPLFILIGYVLWRLHIIFDLCDGDVARYTQKFSINGAYWDYMIHSVLYPMYFIAASVSAYYRFDSEIFLFIGSFGGVLVSQILAVKNNYYRAMLFNGKALLKPSSSESLKRNIVKEIVMHIMSFEGFLAVVTLSGLLGLSEVLVLIVFLVYLAIFASLVGAKFYLFSVNGEYAKRS